MEESWKDIVIVVILVLAVVIFATMALWKVITEKPPEKDYESPRIHGLIVPKEVGRGTHLFTKISLVLYILMILGSVFLTIYNYFFD